MQESIEQQTRSYEMMWGIDRFFLSGEDNPEFFEKFRKKSFKDDFIPSDYSIAGKMDRTYWWDTDFVFDGEFPLALRVDKHTIAVASFDFIKQDSQGTIMISDYHDLMTNVDYPIIAQLQGRPNSQHYLQALKWERMFVTAIEDWARDQGFDSCLGLPAERNEWLGSTHRSHMRYDVTFKRMGYKPWNDFWKKDLQPIKLLE